MKKSKKITVSEKKAPVLKISIVIIGILLLLMALGFFFKKHNEMAEPSFSDKPTLNDDLKTEEEDRNSQNMASVCYNGAYVNSIVLFTDLYIDFYQGQNFSGTLHLLHEQSSNDKYLNQALKYLVDLTNNNGYVSEKEMKRNFEIMKISILKKYSQERFKDSVLLSSVLSILTFYKKGQAALDSGGIEEKMEKAQIALNNDNITEAYKLVLSIKETQYESMTSTWLRTVGYFIRIKEIVEGTRNYIFSEQYSRKFIRTCGSNV